MIRIIGLDPGLNRTGWGVIAVDGSRLRHLAHGVAAIPANRSLAKRLTLLHERLRAILEDWTPDEAAVEETFVNADPRSALKLGAARGIALLVPAQAGLPVAEYAANSVKHSVTGYGHADKGQVITMIGHLLPGSRVAQADAADALAIAICHAHRRTVTAAAARLAEATSP